MKLANNLLNVRRTLALGIVGLTIAANTLGREIELSIAAWFCLLLLLIVYLFDITYHSIGEPKLFSKTLTLLRLFHKGLTTHKHVGASNVKEYYANEQYDWITDPRFPETLLHNRRKDTMAEEVRTYVRNSKVLDLGCGTGLITQLLPGEVTGIDISPWKVGRAQQHCPHATFVVGDIEDLSKLLTDNSFDTVVCTDALEHLEKPDKVVTEAWRVLKPKGIFIGTVPSRSVIWKLRRFLTTADASGEPFHIHYSKRKLQELLRPFNILEISSQCLGLELFFAAVKESGDVEE